MARIEVLEQKETLHLIRDTESGLCAVVEVRAGRAYSPHGENRREAAATPDGMAAVVDADEWMDEARARTFFETEAEDGEYFARRIW